MYNDIISKLTTILATISEIKAVYGYEPQQTTNYPYASVTPIARSSMLKTIGAGLNDRTYTFMIRVVGSLKDTSDPTQTTIRTIADKLDIALEKQSNITLGGTIAYSELSDASFRFVTADSPLYIYEVTYKAKVNFSRNV